MSTQPQLWMPVPTRRRRGRVARALERSLKAAPITRPADEALRELARLLAATLDEARASEAKPYVLAAIVREYRATLTDLGLLAYAAATDPLSEELEHLLRPVGNTAR